MPGILDREPDRPLAEFHPVIDLSSGETAGWEVLEHRKATWTGPSQDPTSRSTVGAIEPDLIRLVLAARRAVPAGRFVGVRLSARKVENAVLRRSLSDAGRLDGLALILRGEMNRDDLRLLEGARERGALVGCDAAAALVHFTALRPDLLSLPEPLGALAHHDHAAGDVVAVLAGMADRIGARALAHTVTSAGEAASLAGLGVALAQGAAFGSPSLRLPAAHENVSSALFRRGKRFWTEGLEEALPSLPATGSITAIVDVCLDHDDHEWVVLVDERSQPVRLIERAALLRGEPFEHRPFSVHPAMPLRGIARAAVDRPARDRSRPLVLCDAAGRYRGLLMIEGMPEALAA